MSRKPVGDKEFDQPCTLLKETLRLLDESDLSLPNIFALTGLPFDWLTRVRAGDIPNPGVNRLQYLYEFLSDRKLIPSSKMGVPARNFRIKTETSDREII